MKIIERKQYIDTILQYIDSPVIKVVTGMRRVGKSMILKSLMTHLEERGVKRENIYFLNKEDLASDHIRTYRDLHEDITHFFFGKGEKKYICIDEIQDIEEWEKCIRSLFSKGEEYDIIITGSNSRLLSGELATYITGRYVEIPIYPLTFSEYRLFVPDAPLSEYIRVGGMPGIHAMRDDDEVRSTYLNGILSTIILRDILMRFSVRNQAILIDIFRFFVDNIGSLISIRRITQFLKSQRLSISEDTLRDYTGYFEQTFLLSRVPRYDIRGKKLLEFNEKYYIADIGLRNAFLGYRDGDISQFLENIVFHELRFRGYTVSTGQGREGREVDFIAEKGNSRLYIQVAYLLSHEETRKREFLSLEEIDDHYPKCILSLDPLDIPDSHGIRTLNLERWLLGKETI